MTNVNTTVTVTAQAQGFAQAQQAATRFTQSLATGIEKIPFKQFKKEMDGLDKQLTTIAKKQLDLNKAIEDMGGAAKAPKHLTDEMERLDKATGRVEQRMRLMNRAHRDHAKSMNDSQRASGGFTQGFLQGAIPGAGYLERGPGVWRQAAGTALGSSVRGMATGIGSSMWTGVGGVAQALGNLPFGLGAPAQAALSAAAGYAGQAKDYNRLQQEARPLLGTTPDFEAATGRSLDAMMNRGRRSDGLFNRKAGLPIPMDDIVSGTRSETDREQMARAKSVFQKTLKDSANDKRGTLFGSNVGTAFGMSKPEMLQMALGVSGASGAGEADVTGFMGAAMGAKRAYGISEHTSGAFLGAGTKGAIAGGKLGATESGDLLARTIGDALGMGLEKSEVGEHLSMMASAMESWKQSGIPLNDRFMGEAGSAFGENGIGGVRGRNLAMGLKGAGERLATAGPESAVDMLAMRKLGGYNFSGGADGLQQAKIKMETGKFSQEEIQGFLQELFVNLGPNAAHNDIVAQKNLGKFGMKLSNTEAKRMGDIMRAKASGQEIKKEDSDFIVSKSGQLGPQTNDGLAMAGMAMTMGSQREEAALTNKQIAVGSKLIATMNNFDNSLASLAAGFTTLASGPMEALSKSARVAAGKVESMSDALQKMLGNLTFGGN